MPGLYYDYCIQFSVTVNLFGSLNLVGLTPAVFYNENCGNKSPLQTAQRKRSPVIQVTGASLPVGSTCTWLARHSLRSPSDPETLEG